MQFPTSTRVRQLCPSRDQMPGLPSAFRWNLRTKFAIPNRSHYLWLPSFEAAATISKTLQLLLLDCFFAAYFRSIFRAFGISCDSKTLGKSIFLEIFLSSIRRIDVVVVVKSLHKYLTRDNISLWRCALSPCPTGSFERQTL